ncbi:hypothetical protein ACFXKS_30225 [Streptomyces scopuliridis]|uniref:hypothetical protein n=1 Tax=Streptomyces scopuliridis TaxID=452529 RepID=UPI00367427D4
MLMVPHAEKPPTPELDDAARVRLGSDAQATALVKAQVALENAIVDHDGSEQANDVCDLVGRVDSLQSSGDRLTPADYLSSQASGQPEHQRLLTRVIAGPHCGSLPRDGGRIVGAKLRRPAAAGA